jgi:hypothetical protein
MPEARGDERRVKKHPPALSKGEVGSRRLQPAGAGLKNGETPLKNCLTRLHQ